MRRCQNCKKMPVFIGATLCADCAMVTRMLGVTILVVVGLLLVIAAAAIFSPSVPPVGQ